MESSVSPFFICSFILRHRWCPEIRVLALFGIVSFRFFCDFYHLIYSLFLLLLTPSKSLFWKNCVSRNSDFSIQLFNVVNICVLKIKVLRDFFPGFFGSWITFFSGSFAYFFMFFSGFLTFQTAGHYGLSSNAAPSCVKCRLDCVAVLRVWKNSEEI